MSRYSSYANIGKQIDNGKQQSFKKGSILKTKNNAHKQLIISQNKIVCVKITANWCQPCIAISPEYNQLSKEYASKGCVLIEQDFDQLDRSIDPETNAIPAFHFYLNKKHISSITGSNLVKVKEQLDLMIQSI